MKSKAFIKDTIDCINTFRSNPSSISKMISTLKMGIERLNRNDPFLKEIDKFQNELSRLPKIDPLEYNATLSKIAEKELEAFIKNPRQYKKQQKGNELAKILPEGFLSMNPGLIADDGAENPESVTPKLILNKIDKKKLGKEFLTNPKYTQIGIAHQDVDDENTYVLIFAEGDFKEEVEEEKEEKDDDETLPEGDLTELKMAFDLFDRDGSQTIKIEEAMQAMKSMNFNETNPVLYKIIEELTDREIVSWPRFANHVVGRMTNRKDEGGLKTIFDLFIDNPKNQTITFDTFKRICKEIGENLTDDEMKHILSNTTENGNEISFNDFCQYMKVE